MGARRGRPPVGERVAVRLPEPLLDAIDRRAAASGRSRAATIRELLADAVASAAEGSDGASVAGEQVAESSSATGVDLAQIRRSLRRTPAERIRHNTLAVNRLRRMRGSANR